MEETLEGLLGLPPSTPSYQPLNLSQSLGLEKG